MFKFLWKEILPPDLAPLSVPGYREDGGLGDPPSIPPLSDSSMTVKWPQIIVLKFRETE